jgi:hypothetical protein
MGALIAERKGYSPLQVQSSLDRILAGPEQPRFFGKTLASFHGRMVGLLEPLVVVAIIPGSAGHGGSTVRHVLLRAALPVPSVSEERLVGRLHACLGDPTVLSSLLATRLASDFAALLSEVLESSGRPFEEARSGRNAERTNAKGVVDE